MDVSVVVRVLAVVVRLHVDTREPSLALDTSIRSDLRVVRCLYSVAYLSLASTTSIG